jgi:hypothetical protein
VILTDPCPENIEQFISSNLPALYNDLRPLLEIEGLSKLVVELEEGRLRPLDGLRSDAVPVSLRMKSTGVTSSSRVSRGDGSPLSTGPSTKSARGTTSKKTLRPKQRR